VRELQDQGGQIDGLPVGAVCVTTITAGVATAKWGAGMERGVRDGRRGRGR